MLNQFAKISPIVDEYGYLLSLDKNGEYTEHTGIKLKENEIGICIYDNSLITIRKGSPIKLGSDSAANVKNISTVTLPATENITYDDDILLYNTTNKNYILSRIDIQFTEDESTGLYTYYSGNNEYSYCKMCIYSDINDENKRYIIDTDNTGMNSIIINKKFSDKLYMRLLPNHLDNSNINYDERITKIIGSHPINITIIYDQEG